MKSLTFVAMLMFSGCVYVETITPEHEFLIQLDNNFDFDSTRHEFDVVNGEVELIDFKSKIYKVTLNKSRGGKTKIFGQTVKETSNGDNYDRLIVYEKEDDFIRKTLYSLSYTKILQLDTFRKDGITVYRLPKVFK